MSRPLYGTSTTVTAVTLTASDNSVACKDIQEINSIIETHNSILSGLLENKDKNIAKSRLDLLDVRLQTKLTDLNNRFKK